MEGQGPAGVPGPHSRHTAHEEGFGCQETQSTPSRRGLAQEHATVTSVTQCHQCHRTLQLCPALPSCLPHPGQPRGTCSLPSSSSSHTSHARERNSGNFCHASIPAWAQCPDETWGHVVKSWEENEGKLQPAVPEDPEWGQPSSRSSSGMGEPLRALGIQGLNLCMPLMRCSGQATPRAPQAGSTHPPQSCTPKYSAFLFPNQPSSTSSVLQEPWEEQPQPGKRSTAPPAVHDPICHLLLLTNHPQPPVVQSFWCRICNSAQRKKNRSF